MPAPYLGHIDPEMQELHKRLLSLQVSQAERLSEREAGAPVAGAPEAGGGIEAAMQTAGAAAEQTALLQEQLAATERERERVWDWKEEAARATVEEAQRKALAPQYEKIKTGEGREAYIKFDPVTQETTEIYKAPEPPVTPFAAGGNQLVLEYNKVTGRWEPIWIPRRKLAPGERLTEEKWGTTIAPAEELRETTTSFIYMREGQLVNMTPKLTLADDEFFKVTPGGVIQFFKKDDPETVIRQELPEDFAKATEAEMIEALAVEKTVEQKWYELKQENKVIAISDRIAKTDDRYKMGMLSVAQGDLVRKTNLDESVKVLEDKKLEQAKNALASLDAWRLALRATEKDKATYMGDVLEFEKNKFNTTHEYNSGQDAFLNDLLTRAADREDERLALTTAVERWTKAREDARLDLDQLKEQHQDLLGWADKAIGIEGNKLLEQANEINLLIAGYNREIGLLDARIRQSQFELLQWEKLQTVPTGVAEAEARIREAEARIEEMGRPEFIKLGRYERGFMLRPGEEVPTAVPGMEPLPEVAQGNIMAELMGQAMKDVKAPAGLELPEDMRLLALNYFKTYVRADERLDEPRKAYYIGLADVLAGRAPKLSDMIADPELRTGIPWMPGSLTIEQFMREWSAADTRRKGVKPTVKTKKVTTENKKKWMRNYSKAHPNASPDEIADAARKHFGE